MNDVVARRVVVAGRVQGVFFRDACRHRAVGEGLTGWVRNRADGTVEAWFEGPRRAVDALVAWCRQGSPGAEIDHVDVSDEAPAGEGAFRVR